MSKELSASVGGYSVTVRTVMVGDILSTYTVWIAPEDKGSPEQYGAIRILPNECEEAIILGALQASYPEFPAEKRPDVFGKVAELLLQLKV